VNMESNKQQSLPTRVFINDVDRYSSKHIAQGSEEAEDTSASPGGEPAFQVVGTVSASAKQAEESFLLEQYESPTRDELLERMLECDVVVYNISETASQQQVEEASWALTALQAEMENFKSQKLFILVSTVMTWAMTKPQNPDETDVVLSEEEYIRRRPHISFRRHHNLEKLVLKLHGGKKSQLKGYVVASGLQYGKGENLFHYFFKVSWLMQFPKVPVFGQGTNYIPMIHVNDLGGVIQNIIEVKPKLKSKYILAVDDSKNTLEEIVKAITMKAFQFPLFQPEELQFLSIDLRLDTFMIKDIFTLNWTSEAGMVENMRSIVKEYKDTRQLLPIRLCIVGPPAVGKTTVAEKLCSHYQIHHITIKEVIEEKITQLVSFLFPLTAVIEEVSAAAQKKLETLNKSMEMNAGRLADHLVFDILQDKLHSKPCSNQGFVLDGFPKTYEQASMIFTGRFPPLILLQHVFVLNASDDFLKERAQGLPQSVAEELGYTQEEFTARLSRYRERSIEIHPEHIGNVHKATERSLRWWAPKNYGLSPEELEVESRHKEEGRRLKLAAEAAEKKRRNEAALAAMAAQYEEWQNNLSEVRRQEEELLEARCLPLRNYLMKYVMPSLSEAMLECSKIKPEDPVDFLAEHLLSNNQEEQH
uniref:Adenylate kinase 7a n=1 Tax=Labrus bergylta TaxID=56723 RepID=A0A3Q3FK31_9LABR